MPFVQDLHHVIFECQSLLLSFGWVLGWLERETATSGMRGTGGCTKVVGPSTALRWPALQPSVLGHSYKVLDQIKERKDARALCNSNNNAIVIVLQVEAEALQLVSVLLHQDSS